MTDELLKKWLDDMGIDAPLHDGSYVFATGTIAIILTPDDDDEHGSFIGIECAVLLKPRVGVNLYRDLLNRNANVRIGSFSLEGDTVMFTYMMPAVEGAGADFARILKMVARIANDASTELQKLHGGRLIGRKE